MLALTLTLAFLPGDVAVPTLDMLRVTRSARATAEVFDPSFTDSQLEVAGDTSTTGEWIASPDADLWDAAGMPAARGRVYHESVIGASSISLSLDAFASCEGLHEFATATGHTTFVSSFQLAAPARFSLRAGAERDEGTGSAEVRLTGPGGNIIDLSASPGERSQGVEQGWLSPGRYTLTAISTVEADALFGEPVLISSSAELEFRVHPLADFDLDGQVTLMDRRAFGAAYRRRESTADFDRDGRVTVLDDRAFNAAWTSQL